MTEETEDALETIRIEREDSAGQAFRAVVLHGLGADGNDLAPLVHQLPAMKRVDAVLPNAPKRPIGVNGGMVMRAWYNIVGIDLQADQDAEGIRASCKAITLLIRREVDNGIAPERIVLAGFSQGGAMALHTGLRLPFRIGGIACLSGYVPLADTLKGEMSPHAGQVPVFMAHGTRDPIVPVQAAQDSCELLRELGLDPEYREYPIDHTISLEETQALNGWVGRVCAADGASPQNG